MRGEQLYDVPAVSQAKGVHGGRLKTGVRVPRNLCQLSSGPSSVPSKP